MSRVAVNAEELQNTFIDRRVDSLLPQFEALAPFKRKDREKGKGDLIGWKMLAANEAALLKATYPDNKPDPEKTYGTCLRQITALKKALKTAAKTDLKDSANYHPVLTIVTHFSESLSYLFAEYKIRQNADYRERVEERSKKENRIELDLSLFLKYANEVLLAVASGATPVEVDWRDVSCAIALATGRRMAEVHLSGEFRQTGEYQLGFKGQLKGKSRKLKAGEKRVALRDYEFEIPSLVKAKLVVEGVEWLEKHGKRIDKSEDPERVNRRFSKVFNGQSGIVRENWEILPDGMTYHKFRGAYFRACLINSGVSPFDYLSYARSILGDKDEATIRAYQRFEIKPGSLTRI